MNNIKERYDIVCERIKNILLENTVDKSYQDYFIKTSHFLIDIMDLYEKVNNNDISNFSIEEHKKLNYNLYKDILKENYDISYANPTYAVKILGEKYGQMLSFLYVELRADIVMAFEKRLFDLVISFELFVEIYNIFEKENEHTPKDIKSAIYYYMYDYSEDMVKYRIKEMLDVNLTFAKDIIMNSNLFEEKYLYLFGEYISENEINISKFLADLPQTDIDNMAKVYVDGYIEGFENSGIDLTKKKNVNIRYTIGFERIVKSAIEQFAKIGLNVVIFRAAARDINKNKNAKVGYCSTGFNKQYDYDHRYDKALYLDKAFIERKLEVLKMAYENYKEQASVYAGPAVIETFGEAKFLPIQKSECLNFDEKQEKLFLKYQTSSSLITNEYIKGDEISFTIIAYPIPEIGENFEEIFKETIKINCLDKKIYKDIQQKLIDALDKGDFVEVTGRNGNITNIKINLYKLKDSTKETIFENCLADVNIPVGEVFTSPMLKDTNGVLHVSDILLNDMEYKNLKLYFKDGKIVDYSCANFDNEKENKDYIKQNLLKNNETLPMGEFAIGTNTTAYVMGKKYNISDRLPILIAEKTGPHFAIGDTCYKMAEDNKIFNPDKKEVVAKENEISALRKTDISSAYFNCHTDITIPYNELGSIIVVCTNGEKIKLIENGRFVLKGTEELNKVF